MTPEVAMNSRELGAAIPEARASLASLPCRVCGLPLGPKLPRRGPRPSYHYDCGRFASYLKSVVNVLATMDEYQRMRARRLLIVAANGLPINWQRDRDERGRFVSTVTDDEIEQRR